ncbi:hypothetical protein THAOC_17770, partial [Thalassiosira oceanica]
SNRIAASSIAGGRASIERFCWVVQWVKILGARSAPFAARAFGVTEAAAEAAAAAAEEEEDRPDRAQWLRLGCCAGGDGGRRRRCGRYLRPNGTVRSADVGSRRHAIRSAVALWLEDEDNMMSPHLRVTVSPFGPNLSDASAGLEIGVFSAAAMAVAACSLQVTPCIRQSYKISIAKFSAT